MREGCREEGENRSVQCVGQKSFGALCRSKVDWEAGQKEGLSDLKKDQEKERKRKEEKDQVK